MSHPNLNIVFKQMHMKIALCSSLVSSILANTGYILVFLKGEQLEQTVKKYHLQENNNYFDSGQTNDVDVLWRKKLYILSNG